jgi:hypothetical protein
MIMIIFLLRKRLHAGTVVDAFEMDDKDDKRALVISQSFSNE